MTTQIIPFVFENNNIRVTDQNGEPWFVARDVALALGYKNTTDAVRMHCRRAKSLIELGRAPSAPQQDQQLTLDPQTKLIPESDVYRLTMKSTLESAERFQDWLVEEVIPQIRKTGSFTVAHAPAPAPLLPSQIGKQIIIDMVDVAVLLGAPKSYAIQVAAGAATKQTGLPWDRLLTQSAAMNNVPDEEVYLEPTELGKKFGLSAAQMNVRIMDFSLQRREGREWVPTEEGAAFCQRHAWTANGKSGYNWKWQVSEIERRMAQALIEA
jgi:prophage antirepressor-like protein